MNVGAANRRPYIPSPGERVAFAKQKTGEERRANKCRIGLKIFLDLRLPPAFLIRQKSKIFDTFPPGEGMMRLSSVNKNPVLERTGFFISTVWAGCARSRQRTDGWCGRKRTLRRWQCSSGTCGQRPVGPCSPGSPATSLRYRKDSPAG